jgi:hypothetical protein
MKKLSYSPRAVMVILILVLGLLFFHSPDAFAASLTVKGYVVKGPVAGASVKFFALTSKGGRGVKLKAVMTDVNGYFKAKLDPAPIAPFLIEATGGSFVDEATDETVPMTTPDILTAAVKPGTKVAMVTPLTHFASVRARAMAKAGVPLKAAINAAYAGVARQYDLMNIGTIIPAANDGSDQNLPPISGHWLVRRALPGSPRPQCSSWTSQQPWLKISLTVLDDAGLHAHTNVPTIGAILSPAVTAGTPICSRLSTLAAFAPE